MKKLLAIIVLGLLWGNFSLANELQKIKIKQNIEVVYKCVDAKKTIWVSKVFNNYNYGLAFISTENSSLKELYSLSSIVYKHPTKKRTHVFFENMSGQIVNKFEMTDPEKLNNISLIQSSFIGDMEAEESDSQFDNLTKNISNANTFIKKFSNYSDNLVKIYTKLETINEKIKFGKFPTRKFECTSEGSYKLN